MADQNKQRHPLPQENSILLDVDGAVERLAGKQWIYHRILEQFVSDCRGFTETMGRCLANQDRDGAVRLAHKMKGAAGQTGAKALYEMAPDLQQVVGTQPTDMAMQKLAEFEICIGQTIGAVNDFLLSQGVQTPPDRQPVSEPEKVPAGKILESIRHHVSMGRFSQVERIIDGLENSDRAYAAFCEGIRRHIRTYDEAAIAAYIDRWR
jgi:HPt (histidine-containing phosphotransfer) domain-containing protein